MNWLRAYSGGDGRDQSRKIAMSLDRWWPQWLEQETQRGGVWRVGCEPCFGHTEFVSLGEEIPVQGVGSRLTEAHTNVWQSVGDATCITTQCCSPRPVCHLTCEDSEPPPGENRWNTQSALCSSQACSPGQLAKTAPSSEWLLPKKLIGSARDSWLNCMMWWLNGVGCTVRCPSLVS